jgi:hypothetical protein
MEPPHLFHFAAAKRQHVNDSHLLAMHAANPVLAANPHIMRVLRENVADTFDSVALFHVLVEGSRPLNSFANAASVGGVDPATGQYFRDGRIISASLAVPDHYVVHHTESGGTARYPANFLFRLPP